VFVRSFIFLVVVLCPAAALAQIPASRVLFRVFLSDGRVLASYGEWARVDDRVIFSIPTRLASDPVELHLVNIAASRVDWPRTELYADSVRAAAYADTRGEAEFAAFSAEAAAALNQVAQINEPRPRLQAAERARQALADWPASHYGYRIGEVRQAIGVLDEVISQLRVSLGQTRFDLSLSAPLVEPPPPPLPPPSDAELVEQLVASASLAESPVERLTLLQSVMRVLDRAVGMLPDSWADRVRRSVSGDLEQEQKVARAWAMLRQRSLETAARLSNRGTAVEFERLREQVRQEARILGGGDSGDIAALLSTIDVHAAGVQIRSAKDDWGKREPAFRQYRRATNGSFNAFRDATASLEQIRLMTGPPQHALPLAVKQLSAAGRKLGKVLPPTELVAGHTLVQSAWQLAESALQMRNDGVARNSADLVQRASSAAAGALMLYSRARADLTAAMAPPAQ